MKALFRDKVRIEGMTIAYKPGTKMPTAMNTGTVAEHIEACITESKNKIVIIPPNKDFHIKNEYTVVNEEPFSQDEGINLYKKYRIKSHIVIKRATLNYISLEVEVINE